MHAFIHRRNKCRLYQTHEVPRVYLDENLIFAEHIKRIAKKAEIKMAALTRVLSNLGNSSNAKRTALCSHSVDYPVCSQCVPECATRENFPEGACGYRRISKMTVQVTTRVLSITLLAEERCRLHLLENAQTLL